MSRLARRAHPRRLVRRDTRGRTRRRPRGERARSTRAVASSLQPDRRRVHDERRRRRAPPRSISRRCATAGEARAQSASRASGVRDCTRGRSQSPPSFDRGEHRRCAPTGAEDAPPSRRAASVAEQRATRRVEAADVGVVADEPRRLVPEGVHRADALGERREAVAARGDGFLVRNRDVARRIARPRARRASRRARPAGRRAPRSASGMPAARERGVLKARARASGRPDARAAPAGRAAAVTTRPGTRSAAMRSNDAPDLASPARRPSRDRPRAPRRSDR